MAALLGRHNQCFVLAILPMFLIHACATAGQRLFFPENTELLGPTGGPGSIRMRVLADTIVVDNGLIEVTFENPGGDISNIMFGGLDNFLMHTARNRRGYLDLVWTPLGANRGSLDKVDAKKFEIVTQTDDLVELSFIREWNRSNNSVPLNIDRRYIIRSGVAGVYVYAIYEHLGEWPAFELGQTRLAYKLNEDKFHYIAISDTRQRTMPTAEDRIRGRTLDYKEAVLLTNSSNPEFKGEVDDKYQYSEESENIRVHGWISENPHVGFWMISPSYEFRTCGPLKQELTSHVGPVTLSTFMTDHYSGRDVRTIFKEGESWKKVFGPVMIYVNQAHVEEGHSALWEDSKRQMVIETQNWPYSFAHSKDYPHSDRRGTVSGHLLVRDNYLNEHDFPANAAYVGLAKPGELGSWQKETKGYQFWTRADRDGRFKIKNVRPGSYNLYAWVPGFVGDYKYETVITVIEALEIHLGSLVYKPPRQGPTLWEIGIPDRKAAEFYVPQVAPNRMNKLYNRLKQDWFRQYGLWERYTDLYPKDDLVYNVGTSNYTKDWFFAHVSRDLGNEEKYAVTTWRVKFELGEVDHGATYTLQMALASANGARIEVRFNVDPSMGRPLFSTGLIGYDNAIARHGIHGMYHFYSIGVPGRLLQRGTNTMYLTQSFAAKLSGVMYDYIRLEGPPHF